MGSTSCLDSKLNQRPTWRDGAELSAAALRTLNVVQIFDYGIDEGTPFIAMELLEGESLASRIKRLGKLSKADVPPGFARWFARACSRDKHQRFQSAA